MDLDFFFGPQAGAQTAAKPATTQQSGATDFYSQAAQRPAPAAAAGGNDFFSMFGDQAAAQPAQPAAQPFYQQPSYPQNYPPQQPFASHQQYPPQQPFGSQQYPPQQPYPSYPPPQPYSQPYTPQPYTQPQQPQQLQQPKPVYSPQTSPQPAQPTQNFSSDDFLDLLGAPAQPAAAAKPTTPGSPKSAAAALAAPASAAASNVAKSQPYKRGQSKGETATTSTRNLNMDAFSKLAVSRKPVGTTAKPAASKKESESESESESGTDEEDAKQAPKKTTVKDDDEDEDQGMGQGFSPIDRSGGKCAAADCANARYGESRYCSGHQRYEAPSASKPADVEGRKVKGEWSIERKRTGTKMGFIKNITIWKFYFKGEQHTVELRHSTFSGKRVIVVDGRQLLSEKRLIGGDAAHKVFGGSDFNTRCEITVVIKSNNDRFQYGIFIEGLPIRDAKLKYAEYI